MIDAERVTYIFTSSLSPDGKRVEGITMDFGLKIDERYREEVKGMLRQLNDNFFDDTGGGWSFLQMCVTKDGQQWGEHRNMQELCCLAIALDLGKWLMPREFWRMMPGGMPYIVFTRKEIFDEMGSSSADVLPATGEGSSRSADDRSSSTEL